MKAYAKAQEIVYNRRELELWKLGVYFQRANASLWDKDSKYPEEPIFRKKTEAELQLEEDRKLQSMKSFWEAYAVHNNAKFRDSSGVE